VFKIGRKRSKFKNTMFNDLTREQAQKLGLNSSIKIGEDIGFVDFKKTSAISVSNAYLDLENLGALNKTNPRLVIRNPIFGDKDRSREMSVWESWRQVVEEKHYYCRYNISTSLVGQLLDIHFPLDYYSAQDNNFFKPWRPTKPFKLNINNNFNFGRFRFPEESANTIDIRINSRSGELNFSPKYPGKLSKEESRKAYMRWHPGMTRFASGSSIKFANQNLSGFNIPYPNSVSIYECPAFNAPVKIAPKYNTSGTSQSLNGLIVISTGDAEQKTICYVSPHSAISGYLNTVEDVYTERNTYQKSIVPGYEHLMTVEGASWYGSGTSGYLGCEKSGYLDNLNGTYKEASIPSEDTSRKRFYKLNEPQKQIYFDSNVLTQYGSGSWVVAISGNSNLSINTGQNGVVYVYQPNSRIDWLKHDPRKLNGVWAVASGHPKAAASSLLSRASVQKPIVSTFKSCRKERVMISKLLQLPSLIIGSEHLNSGYVLPEGIKDIKYTYSSPVYSTWRSTAIVTGEGINTGILYNPTGNNYSGYIINDNIVTVSQVLASGITIPYETLTGSWKGIDANGHFAQQTPLRDTHFYRFYNDLYKGNKKIATGTWNGIIPSGVRFSVELISTSLNTNVGINNGENIAVIYSGYGSRDFVDVNLQTGISQKGAHILYPNPSEKYMISGEVPWIQNRYPYRHAFNEFGQLAYSAYQSGPTEDDARGIAKITAIKTINSKILQLVNKIFPNLTYKNKKWRRMQEFKQKLKWLNSGEFSYVDLPETALPGAEIRKRISKYASGQA